MLFSYSSSFTADRKVSSTVTSVTVYSDRAYITRTAQEQLAAGTQTLVITDLPVTLIDKSIRVVGESEGKAKILDVKVQTVFLDTIPEDRIRQLTDRLKALKSEQQTLNDRQSVLRSKISLIDSIKVYYPRDLKGSAASKSGVFDEWERMLSFLEKNLTVIFARILETGQKLNEVKGKIETVEKEIQQTRGYSRKSQKQISVTLNAARPAQVKLNISYLMSSARWEPTYEVRVLSNQKTLQLTYSGMVSQSTNEDWKNIDLVLSTAQPSASGAPPELLPWYLDVAAAPVFKDRSTASLSIAPERIGQGTNVQGSVVDKQSGLPLAGANVTVEGLNLGAATDANGAFVLRAVPHGTHPVRASYIGYEPYTVPAVRMSPNTTVWINFQLAPMQLQLSEVAVMGARTPLEDRLTKIVEPEAAQVQTQATSAIFTIASKVDVPSDNNPHKVGITVETLPVEYEYSCVPKLSPFAYLKARVKNTSEFPLLGGTMNVFFDESFVATSTLGTVLPQEQFDAHIGIDEGVKIERKLLNRLTEYSGLFTKKTKVTYDIIVKVENRKTIPVDLIVYDQVPVSRNEKIVVETIAPLPKELSADATGLLNWKLKLNPSEKRELPLKFSIEYPSDLHVTGLE